MTINLFIYLYLKFKEISHIWFYLLSLVCQFWSKENNYRFGFNGDFFKMARVLPVFLSYLFILKFFSLNNIK